MYCLYFIAKCVPRYQRRMQMQSCIHRSCNAFLLPYRKSPMHHPRCRDAGVKKYLLHPLRSFVLPIVSPGVLVQYRHKHIHDCPARNWLIVIPGDHVCIYPYIRSWDEGITLMTCWWLDERRSGGAFTMRLRGG